jgi:hypothetical protein
MISRTVTLPELGMIAGTRAALGAGIALLLGDRLDRKPKRAVGWTLVAVGALSTVPLLIEVFQSTPSSKPVKEPLRGLNGTPQPGSHRARRKVHLAT